MDILGDPAPGDESNQIGGATFARQNFVLLIYYLLNVIQWIFFLLSCFRFACYVALCWCDSIFYCIPSWPPQPTHTPFSLMAIYNSNNNNKMFFFRPRYACFVTFACLKDLHTSCAHCIAYIWTNISTILLSAGEQNHIIIGRPGIEIILYIYNNNHGNNNM